MIAIGRAGAADRFKLFDRGQVSVLARFCQEQIVLDVDHRHPACDLPRPNVGGEEIRAHLYHASGHKRPP